MFFPPGGAEVNRSSEGLNMNALFLAVKWQQTDMVRHLLSSGADCRLKVGQGQKVSMSANHITAYTVSTNSWLLQDS